MREWIEFEGMVGVVDNYFGVPTLYFVRNGEHVANCGSMEGEKAASDPLHVDAGEGC